MSNMHVCILETIMEGTVAQIFYLGPSFHFMKCGKKDENSLKVTFFLSKIKTKC